MSTDFQNLKLRIATLGAEELLDMVTFDAADFRSEALELVREELQKRGYSDADLQDWYDSAGDRSPGYAGGQFIRMRFGVNVAALALMLVVTYQLGRAALVDIATLSLALISAFMLFRFRVNSAWLILGGAIVGWVLYK